MDIVATELTKSYGPEKVLDRFSGTFRKGGVTCVMGASGCGKTTLIHILMGLIQPDSGSVSGMPDRKSAVFQEDRLCEEFSAETNVAMVLDAHADRALIRAHLDEIGLQDDRLKPVREYSGGMKRRVALVRAIWAQSDVLFLDEPLKGLDERTKESVVSYLKRHFNGRTVIMVTHDRDELAAFGAELITLGRGCEE